MAASLAMLAAIFGYDNMVHLYTVKFTYIPEPRAFYALEKMWALENEAADKPVKKAAAKRAAPKTARKPAARRKRAS